MGSYLSRTYLFHPPQCSACMDSRITAERNAYARRLTSEQSPRVLLFFHGNAVDVFGRCDDPNIRFPDLPGMLRNATGHETWAVEYPGYAGCPGTPDTDTIVASAKTSIKLALQRAGGDPGRLTCVGHSIGTGIAVRACHELGVVPGRLVLISPFSGIAPMVGEQAKLWSSSPRFGRMVSKVLYDPLPTLRLVSSTSAPLLVVHGLVDNVVPVEQARAVFAASAAPETSKRMHIFQDGHNWQRPANVSKMVQEIAAFVQAEAAATRGY